MLSFIFGPMLQSPMAIAVGCLEICSTSDQVNSTPTCFVEFFILWFGPPDLGSFRTFCFGEHPDLSAFAKRYRHGCFCQAWWFVWLFCEVWLCATVAGWEKGEPSPSEANQNLVSLGRKWDAHIWMICPYVFPGSRVHAPGRRKTTIVPLTTCIYLCHFMSQVIMDFSNCRRWWWTKGLADNRFFGNWI